MHPRLVITERVQGVPTMGTCSACPQVTFASDTSPTSDSLQQLQREFDDHYRTKHDTPARWGVVGEMAIFRQYGTLSVEWERIGRDFTFIKIEKIMINGAERRVAQARILVVDDEETIREIIISMLVKAGYECREAATGLEALALLHSGERFDLMLTDLLMPGLNGVDLLDRTRMEYPDMPVVIACTVQDIAVVIETFRHGACDYLPVPFPREQLLLVVTRALECHKRRREHQAYVSKLESQVAELTERLRVAKP